jgi:hypothetical protein
MGHLPQPPVFLQVIPISGKDFIMLNRISYCRCLSIIAGFLLAASANANLIVNGGFEDNAVAPGNWNYFSSASVNGWDGDNIEIWNQMGGVVAPEGLQHAELNAHPFDGSLFTIYQNFATVIGQTYDVSFYYSARVDSNEEFSFSVDSLNAILNDHVVGSWKQYTGSFVASNALSTISFTTSNTSTYGNFLDDVVVMVREPQVDLAESNPLVMLLIGLAGLMFIRRRNSAC